MTCQSSSVYRKTIRRPQYSPTGRLSGFTLHLFHSWHNVHVRANESLTLDPRGAVKKVTAGDFDNQHLITTAREPHCLGKFQGLKVNGLAIEGCAREIRAERGMRSTALLPRSNLRPNLGQRSL
jgi:hypothetical protein